MQKTGLPSKLASEQSLGLPNLYNFATSAGLSIRRLGPPLLPSPTKSELVPLLKAHFSLNSASAVPSKQSAMYFPTTGKNLNALF